MDSQQIKHSLETIDKMLEKADAQQELGFETSQAVGALIIAISNLRDIVNEILLENR